MWKEKIELTYATEGTLSPAGVALTALKTREIEASI
jgi:hypothetical protein